MGEIKWGDPPPKQTAGPSTGHVWREFVAELKVRPGEWAQYEPDRGHQRSYASTMTKRNPGLETTTRTRPDGKFDVYARWVGNGSEPH